MNHQNQWLAFQYIFNRDRVSCLKFRTLVLDIFSPSGVKSSTGKYLVGKTQSKYSTWWFFPVLPYTELGLYPSIPFLTGMNHQLEGCAKNSSSQHDTCQAIWRHVQIGGKRIYSSPESRQALLRHVCGLILKDVKDVLKKFS
jgi:hypothetical protein